MPANPVFGLTLLLGVALAHPQWHPQQDWDRSGWGHWPSWQQDEKPSSVDTSTSHATIQSKISVPSASTSISTSLSVPSPRHSALTSSTIACTPTTVTLTRSEMLTVTLGSPSSVIAATLPSSAEHAHHGHPDHGHTKHAGKHTEKVPSSSTRTNETAGPTTKTSPTIASISTPESSSPEILSETSSVNGTSAGWGKGQQPTSQPWRLSSSPDPSSLTSTVPITPPPITSSVSSSATAPISTPSVEPSPTSTPSGKSKRGLITFDELIPYFQDNPKISWNMNWWHGPPPDKPASWLFVPELTHLEPDQWWADATFRKDPASYPYIAGFLEPGVNNISVDDAVKSWKTNLEPLSTNHKLIPPIAGQNDLPWLKEFMSACTGCTFDGPIAFTLYVTPDDAGIADFENHVKQFTEAFPDKDIWAANIGILGDSDMSKSDWLMRRVVPYLDGLDRISHYAWNGADSFWDGTGVTPLAELYASL